MPLEERDAAYLWDMLHAAKEVMEMVDAQDLASFVENRMLLRATERSIEIIGEAARRVSTACMEENPDIPWREIIGQRNILAHEYGQIDHELLYKTVVEDIPELVVQLDARLIKIDDSS